MHDGVPFGLTIKIVGPFIVRLGGKGILGRGTMGTKVQRKRDQCYSQGRA